MRQLLVMAFLGLALTGCKSFLYKNSLGDRAISVEKLGLEDSYQLMSVEDKVPAGKLIVQKVSDTQLNLLVEDVNGKREDGKEFVGTAVEIKGEKYIEMQSKNQKGLFSLIQIKPIDKANPDKIGIFEQQFTEPFLSSDKVELHESSWISAASYIADNSSMTAEELVENSEFIKSEFFHEIFEVLKK